MNSFPEPEDVSATRAPQLVRALLERHGLPKHRHASFVSEFFNLSRAASHSRVNRSSAWTVDEFQRLAKHFGEPLAQVVGASSFDESGIRATVKLGGLSIRCRIWLEAQGLQVSSPSPTTLSALVAVEEAGAYLVVPATAASEPHGQRIRRLVIGEGDAPERRVAVFDVERESAEAVCGMLRTSGIGAEAYDDANEFAAVIARDEFDGYVIDWLLPGNKSAAGFLAAVRGLAQHRALVLICGNLRNGMADPREIADATLRFKVQMVEKPILLPMLKSALMNDGLDAARHADVAPA